MFGDVYRLTLRVFTLTQGFSREFKYTLGQEMKRDCLVLLRSSYRINRSRERVPLLGAFLDDFERVRPVRGFHCERVIWFGGGVRR